MGFFSSLVGGLGDIAGSFVGDPMAGDQAVGLFGGGSQNPVSDFSGIFGGGSKGLGGMLTSGSLAGTAANIGANALGTGAQRNAVQSANNQLNPFYQTGLGANNQIASLSGFGPNGSAGIQSTLENMPGYQFSRNQGLLGINNQASAMGLGSNALMGAGSLANNYANTNYQNYFNNLMSLTNMGQQTGNMMGQNTIGLGNAQAGGYLRSGNALAQGAMSGFAGNALNSGYFNQPGMNNDANSYFNNSSSGNASGAGYDNQMNGTQMPFLNNATDMGNSMPWLS